MREMLFRGKREDNGNWIVGSFHKSINDCYIIPLPVVTSKSKVIPETVGQFTGLTDKNGKKIFEGDILRLGGEDLPHWYEVGMIVAVSYEDDGFVPLCEYDSDCGTYVCSTKCEVIGNIHDNPELLEERQ